MSLNQSSANQPTEAERRATAFRNFIQELGVAGGRPEVLKCAAAWVHRMFTCDMASLGVPADEDSAQGTELQLHALVHDDAIPTAMQVDIGCEDAAIQFEDKAFGVSVTEKIGAKKSSPIQSRLSALLLAGGQPVGMLGIASQSPKAYSAQDEGRLRDVANLLAAQLLLHQRVAQAEAHATKEARVSRMLAAMGQMQSRLGPLVDEDAICKVAARFIPSIFRSDRASLAVLDEEGSLLSVLGLSGKAGAVPQGAKFTLAGSLLEESIQTAQVTLFRDLRQLTDHESRELVSLGLRSAICIPLRVGAGVMGGLNIASTRLGAFDSRDIPVYSEVGRIVATALAGVQAHKALELAKREARGLASAKDAFLSNMSHELRTPMNGVLGLSRLLKKSRMTAEQKEHVTGIIRCGEALHGVVENLLDLSILEGEAITLERGEVNLAELMEGVSNTFGPVLRGTPRTLLTERDPGPPQSVSADPRRLTQILEHLVSNAVKFTERGTIKVGAHVVSGDHGAFFLELTVEDTGAGIPPSAHESIFGAFYQGDSSTSRRHDGTGLGLALARQLARHMGGDISVTSEPGLGSSFQLRLPVEAVRHVEVVSGPRPPTRGALNHAARELDPDERTFAASCPLKIMVVDDNPVNRTVAARTLKRLGYQAVVAKCGEESVALAASQELDLVFMDLSMPGMDGFEATELIISNAGDRKRTPVVMALTADAQAYTREHCLEVGMLNVLTKPFTVAELEACLREAHRERTRLRQAA